MVLWMQSTSLTNEIDWYLIDCCNYRDAITVAQKGTFLAGEVAWNKGVWIISSSTTHERKIPRIKFLEFSTRD